MTQIHKYDCIHRENREQDLNNLQILNKHQPDIKHIEFKFKEVYDLSQFKKKDKDKEKEKLKDRVGGKKRVKGEQEKEIDKITDDNLNNKSLSYLEIDKMTDKIEIEIDSDQKIAITSQDNEYINNDLTNVKVI